MVSIIDGLEINKEPKTIRKLQKKIIIIGEGGVGKTTLLHRAVHNIFVDSTKMTIGTSKLCRINDKKDKTW